MKLADWLGLPDAPKGTVFARRIGVSRVTLFRFKTGRRIPDRPTMEKINAETNGDVAPNDFFNIVEPERVAS